MSKQPKRKLRPGVDEYGRSPLHNAIVPLFESAGVNEVEKLLREGADPNLKDDNGFSPLHFAAQESLPEVAKILIDAGADPNIQDEYGNTPLARAVMSGRSISVINILLDAGANPFTENKYGISAAETAINSTANDQDVAKYLKDVAELFRTVSKEKK